MMNRSLIAALLFGVALAQQVPKETGGQNKEQKTFSPVSAEPIAPATQGPVAPSTVSLAPAAISPAPSTISTALATTSAAPSAASLDPATVSPTEATTSTAPSTNSLAPSAVSPAPGTVSLAPSAISQGTTSSAPSAISPIPTLVSPVPTPSTPASNTVTPSGAPSVPDSQAPTAIATNFPSAALSAALSAFPSEAPTILPIPASECRVGCPGSASNETNGFSTVDDLNCQIQYDWDLVQLGKPAPVPPSYVLCPNTAFTMASSSSSTLTLLLNNSFLLCGADGALSNECLLTNVTVQVQNLDSITIRGLSFNSSSLLHTGVGSLEVEDCSFVGQGGPVVMADGTSQTHLTNCTFENMEYTTLSVANNGTTTGDALIYASNGVLELERVQITGTVSTVSMTLDLIRAENAAITINDCQLTNNTVNNMVIGQGTSTVSLSGTTLAGNNFVNGLSCEGTVDVTVNECAITGNKFSTSLVSLSSQGNMVMTDSKFYKNIGGLSIATLRGTARFESVAFNSNVAQIGIEVFSEVVVNAVGWIENEAEWHIYVRSGGSLSFGKASLVSMNLAAVAVFFLESNANCKIQDTLVTINNVTGFHLMSVLDSSTLHLINTTISLNEIANSAIFAYSSSQVLLNQVSLSENSIEKSLFRCTTNSTWEASNVTATKNTNRGDLVVCDTGSSMSVSDADFSDNIVKGGMAVVLNSTATYDQVGLSNNKGGTAQVGMFQSLEGAVLQLTDVYAQSNTFDSFAFVSGASTLDANLVFVSRHVGLTRQNFTSWEVYSISNASSLVLSDSVIDSTIPFAFVHVSDSSSATVDGFHILGETSDTTDELSYGVYIDAKSTTTLDNVCFDGGDYTYPVWSQSGKFTYSNVSATMDTLEATNNDNCRAMFVNDECIDFDSTSCRSSRVTLSPATIKTTAPQAAPSTDSTSNCPNVGRSIQLWSTLAGLVSTFGVFLL